MKRHDVDLMQHADGELELDDLDADGRAKIAAVSDLGEVVRGHLEMSAERVADKRFAAMWREIDKAIDRESPAPVKQTAAAPASFWRRVGRWFDQYRGHIISGAVGAGAVAALALVLRTQQVENTESHPINTTPVVYRPAEIESLDTPGGTGTVFNLQDDDGNTTVIWVTPEDTVEGI